MLILYYYKLMSVKNILQFPNINLEKISNYVFIIDENIIKTIIDMIDTMYYYNGIGISAPQINILKNIIIININVKLKQVLILINPKIVYFNNYILSNEGCLSFPGIFLNVKRYKKIKIIFKTLDGNIITIESNNLLSVCLQHEIDHLNGITLYNKMSNFKKNIYFKKKYN